MVTHSKGAIVDIGEIKHQFVAIYDPKTEIQTGLGLVVSFVTGSPFGIQAKIFDLEIRKPKVVRLEDCRYVPKSGVIVPATVLKLYAWHKDFGQGVVAETRRPRQMQMMEVRLQNQPGHLSGWLVLDDVMLIGPEPKSG